MISKSEAKQMLMRAGYTAPQADTVLRLCASMVDKQDVQAIIELG